MDLILDTGSTRFQTGGEFEPRLDRDGVQRRDKSGGTNLPLWAVQLVAWYDAGTETILVTIAADKPPMVSRGEFVSVERLQAMPWVHNGNSRVAFRAKSIRLISSGNGSGAKPAPAPATH